MLQPGIDLWTSRFILSCSTNWATGAHLYETEQLMKYKSRLLPSTGRTGRLARQHGTALFFKSHSMNLGHFGYFQNAPYNFDETFFEYLITFPINSFEVMKGHLYVYDLWTLSKPCDVVIETFFLDFEIVDVFMRILEEIFMQNIVSICHLGILDFLFES